MHFDTNLVFLAFIVIFGIARVVRNLIENVRENNSEPPKPPSTAVPDPRATDAERALMEALGRVRTSPLPPKAQPRSDLPPRPLSPVMPPVATRLRRVKPRPKQPTPPPVPARSSEGNEPGSWIATEQKPAPVRVVEAPPVEASSSRSSWKELMGTPENLRRAIILREIFGPPRGLRPMETLEI